ncbi:MAG: hypothetical protein IJD20_04640, partial [Oscillospiraceae bacterium]|nr:hypothetical protein [Oscillospiraceae bacterium]
GESRAQRTKKASPVQGEVAFAQQMTEGLSIQSPKKSGRAMLVPTAQPQNFCRSDSDPPP